MNMRKKSWFKRHYAFIMLLFIGIAFILSIRGFWIYYAKKVIY